MQNSRDQNEFNTAIGYVTRLNILFTACDEATLDKNIDAWFSTLIVLFKELSTELKDKEIKEYKALIRDLNVKVKLVLDTSAKTGDKSIPFNVYMDLTDFELKLRKIMKESGLQNKMKEDSLLAMV